MLDIGNVQLDLRNIVSLLTMFMLQHTSRVQKTYVYPTERPKTLYKVPTCWSEYLFKDLDLKKIQ
jgi:hypothetical protein